ncbi:Mg2+/Co2+ transporter CorB [Desulfohalotomaculum tongense]|uniref:hypothetical protein n=1 Tax=Desulforadius tongensis TaxID=1216062 RepID=UPI00195DAE46|nr:hypothetical protein [Desulforadius tongensis]MBM7855498.1 Mg2+/Co2+ transporter CorB [Desulforadius tongensis]
MGHNKSSVSGSYILLVGIGSFSLAVIFAIISELFVRKLDNIALSFIILLVIIFIGIISDTLGTAVTAAQETPFHAMAAKRVMGAQQGVYLIRNADRVANIANDVIGDIAGTVSGALGISIVARLIMLNPGWDAFILNILITSSVASITVSGKALGKKFALSRPNNIIFFVGKNMARLEKLLGQDPFRKNRRSKG